ncbi:hypothetical protein OGAPHI_006379 [Ogataea philodendri]|uniref:RRM domain-containing protein n=2 Tax=Ogataea TaxID=461281 RepID=A0A9P8T0K3_9ASCO|nr:uncharacterized protein OGAPHI_006379 [Ogataea philodendri]KAH3661531.1 hypothetical protein OGAPHI_006379 [Ogataea philodendri]
MGSRVRRIYVGAIAPSLVDNIGDLEKRFEKFGKIEKGFSLHTKEILGYHYGYIMMHIADDQLAKLIRSLNGVNYKGSKLVIQEARPDYRTRWEKDSRRQDTKIKDRQLRDRIAKCRLERIAKKDVNPFELSQVIKGRERKDPRKINPAKITMRTNVKGVLKIVRGRKTKVWGYNKNKHPVDLVWRYIDGEWRDGNDHTVEKVKTDINMGETELEINDEKERTNKMLESWMDSFDFEKPMELDDEEVFEQPDVVGGEINGDFEIEKSEPVEEPAEEPQVSEEEDEDIDTEFLPSFLKKPTEPVEEQTDSKNTTETLRTLLNSTETEQAPVVEEPVPVAAPPSVSRKFALFFSHSDSPFLSAQTQIASLPTVQLGEDYDKWFWENRGEMNRYFRRRRRDVLRQTKKTGRVALI